MPKRAMPAFLARVGWAASVAGKVFEEGSA